MSKQKYVCETCCEPCTIIIEHYGTGDENRLSTRMLNTCVCMNRNDCVWKRVK